MGNTDNSVEGNLERYGLKFHPTRKNTYMLNLEIAVKFFDFPDDEAHRAMVFESMNYIVKGNKCKLVLVKDDTGENNNGV